MTYPDDRPVDSDADIDDAPDPAMLAARASDANEADVIEQAIVVPLGDDDGFDR